MCAIFFLCIIIENCRRPTTGRKRGKISCNCYTTTVVHDIVHLYMLACGLLHLHVNDHTLVAIIDSIRHSLSESIKHAIRTLYLRLFLISIYPANSASNPTPNSSPTPTPTTCTPPTYSGTKVGSGRCLVLWWAWCRWNETNESEY